eukprot:TRINITY_DN22912_c0_g1_i1.p1 TRINITY_DN22912_c0_g1~~TRINITY_DN22912_c0_g1_i1.p1  ORF type:complete len:299 (+),score=93.70 TRINITY_DN22912_c0_g1_i1:64-960(+)
MEPKSYPTKEAIVLRGHHGSIPVVRFNANGNYCASGGNDRTVRLWNPAKGTLIKTYSGHGHEVLDVDIAKDNSKFASCGGDRMVFSWDVATGRTIRKFRGHEARVNCIRYNDEAAVLVTGSYDRTVKIWDTRSNNYNAIQVMDEAKDSVSSIVVTGHEIVAASIDGYIRNYDVRMGRLHIDCIGQPVACVRMSHDGNCLLASTLDSHVRLFDKSTGELLNEYKGHKNSDFKIDSAFSHDDAYVLSGSETGIVSIWDLVDAKVVASLRGHAGAILSLDYHPKEPAVLSTSVDGTIRLWR